MSRLFARKKIAAFGAACFLLTAAGAYAYWTESGAGTGSAATGTNEAVTVNQTSTPTAMYPGGSAQPLSGNFDNPNDGKVHVAAVTVALSSIEDAPAGCSTADYQINNATATINAEIDPGEGVGSWSGPSIQMRNTGSNQDGCKNASVNLTYTST
jgi:hypothetical protein